MRPAVVILKIYVCPVSFVFFFLRTVVIYTSSVQCTKRCTVHQWLIRDNLAISDLSKVTSSMSILRLEHRISRICVGQHHHSIIAATEYHIHDMTMNFFKSNYSCFRIFQQNPVLLAIYFSNSELKTPQSEGWQRLVTILIKNIILLVNICYSFVSKSCGISQSQYSTSSQ